MTGIQERDAELKDNASVRVDNCPVGFAGSHRFIKIGEEPDWQCANCPERRGPGGHAI